MDQMERLLSQIGNPHDQSSPDMPDQSPTELPSNAAGLHTPEALSIVLRRAEQLLQEGACASVSHIAERLEQNLSSTDTSVRSQIQSELVQTGLAMQHLGALFLELGRTMLTLRMGQSPAESVINSGPAVYISPQGPNPLMVQPFPLQTSPLFNSSSVNSAPAPATLGHIGVIGSAPRHINIHIHAGTAFPPLVSAVGARPVSAEGTQGDNIGASVPGNAGSTQILRNITATVVPRAAVGVASTTTMGPAVTGVSSSQTADSSSMASMVAGINDIRNRVASLSAGLQECVLQTSSIELGRGGDTAVTRETSETNLPRSEPQKVLSESQQEGANSSNLFQASSSNELKVMPESTSRESSEIQGGPNVAKSVPLGLGLLGLPPKKRTQSSNAQVNSVESRTSGATSDEIPNTIAAGQQVLQSPATGGNPLNLGLAVPMPMPQARGPGVQDVSIRDQSSRSQPDMMGLMSQVLDNPAFSGILSGIAGVGSGDDLRGMFQQITQSPDARNSINQLAQQVNREDFSSLFSGSGRGEDGAMDFPSMIQQMMPIVSRALSGNTSPQTDSFITVERNQQPEPTSLGQRSEVDIQEIVQTINVECPPQDILRAVAQASLVDNGAGTEELVHELCADEDLANEFIEVFSHDLRRRFHDGPQ